MSTNNGTRHIKWHKNKQSWNNNNCLYECKELIDKGICNEGYVWNPSNCKCECDKSCNFGEYLTMKIVNVEKGW